MIGLPLLTLPHLARDRGLFWVVVPALAAVVVCWVAMAAQRCRDIGWRGWWALLLLVPVGGQLLGLLLLVLPGEETDNRFGPEPVARRVRRAIRESALTW